MFGAVIRRTDNTMAKRRRTNKDLQNSIQKTTYWAEQHETVQRGVNAGAPEW